MVKNTPVNAREVRDVGLTFGSGRCQGGGQGYLLQYSSLENPIEEPGGLQSIGSQRVRLD